MKRSIVFCVAILSGAALPMAAQVTQVNAAGQPDRLEHHQG